MMITNNIQVARYIESHGVHRIFLDQETLGKQERQGHLNTHKAAHDNNDVRAMAAVLEHAELMVRVNPLNSQSETEVNEAIVAGAKRLMLPMFFCADDVIEFKRLVADRVPVTLLAETAASLSTMQDWLPLLDVSCDEVHIGLNDLALDLNMPFLFEPLARGLLEEPAKILNEMDITWGFGGIARVGLGELPADKVLGEHVRLGSNRLILSRAFHQEASSIDELLKTLDFPVEIQKLQDVEEFWRSASMVELEQNKESVAKIAINIAQSKQ